jgi:hypothetical protein
MTIEESHAPSLLVNRKIYIKKKGLFQRDYGSLPRKTY